MAAINHLKNGRSGAREVLVWDPLVRLIHWSVAFAVVINSFLDGEGQIHKWVGYAALGLVIIRLVWGVVGPRYARFSAFPPRPMRALHLLSSRHRSNKTVHLSHNPLGALMVYNLWTAIAVLGVTGYLMGTMRFFGVEWVEEVHEITYNWILVSVVLHVAGVLFDTWRTGVPLVRAMITGRKRVRNGWTAE